MPAFSAAIVSFPLIEPAAFMARRELQSYLRRRLDTFINPLVYTFWDNQGTPSIMTMSSAPAE